MSADRSGFISPPPGSSPAGTRSRSALPSSASASASTTTTTTAPSPATASAGHARAHYNPYNPHSLRRQQAAAAQGSDIVRSSSRASSAAGSTRSAFDDAAGMHHTARSGGRGGYYATGSTAYPTNLSPFGDDGDETGRRGGKPSLTINDGSRRNTGISGFDDVNDDDDDDEEGTVTLHMPGTPSHAAAAAAAAAAASGAGAGVGVGVGGKNRMSSTPSGYNASYSVGPNGYLVSASAPPSPAPTPPPSGQGAGAGRHLTSSSSSTNLAAAAAPGGGIQRPHSRASSAAGSGPKIAPRFGGGELNDIDLTAPNRPPSSAAAIEASLASVFAAISADPSAQASFSRAVTKRIAMTAWEPLAAYLIAYSTMGVGLSLIGPTMLVLGRQVGTTSTSSLSLTYVGRAIGFFLGSLCGGQLVDRLGLHKGQIILCGAIALSAASTLLYPAASTLPALIAVSGLSALFIGCVDNLSQVLLIRVCGQYSEALVQALHAGFAVGSFLAPIVISFFLADVEPEGQPLKSTFYKNAFYAMAGYMAIVCVLVSIVTLRKRGPFGIFANRVQDCERAVAAKDCGIDAAAVAPFLLGTEPAMASLTLPAHAVHDDVDGEEGEGDDEDTAAAESQAAPPTAPRLQRSHSHGYPSQSVGPTPSASPTAAAAGMAVDDMGIDVGDSHAAGNVRHGAVLVPFAAVGAAGGVMAGETLTDLNGARLPQQPGDSASAGVAENYDYRRASFSSISSSLSSSGSLPAAPIPVSPSTGPAAAGAPGTTSPKGAAGKGKFMGWVRNRPSFKGNGAVLLVAVSVMLFFYVGAETGYGHFISPYANKRGFMDDQGASLLNSVFWGSFAIGRVLGIPIAAYVPVDRLAMANIAGAAVTALMLTVFSNSVGVLWAGTALIGLCMASLYASCVVWLDHRIHVSGSVLSVVVVCVSLSEALVPLVMGASFGLPAGPVSMMIVATVLLFACAVIFGWVHRYAALHAAAPAAATAAEVLVRGGRRGRKEGDVVAEEEVELPGYRPQRDLVVVGDE